MLHLMVSYAKCLCYSYSTILSQNLVTSDKPGQNDWKIVETESLIVAEFDLSGTCGFLIMWVFLLRYCEFSLFFYFSCCQCYVDSLFYYNTVILDFRDFQTISFKVERCNEKKKIARLFHGMAYQRNNQSALAFLVTNYIKHVCLIFL